MSFLENHPKNEHLFHIFNNTKENFVHIECIFCGFDKIVILKKDLNLQINNELLKSKRII